MELALHNLLLPVLLHTAASHKGPSCTTTSYYGVQKAQCLSSKYFLLCLAGEETRQN